MTSIMHGQLVGLRRMNNSRNGNPKYVARIYKVDETIDVVTKTDGQVGYYIDNYKIGDWLNFEISGNARKVIVGVAK